MVVLSEELKSFLLFFVTVSAPATGCVSGHHFNIKRMVNISSCGVLCVGGGIGLFLYGKLFKLAVGQSSWGIRIGRGENMPWCRATHAVQMWE